MSFKDPCQLALETDAKVMQLLENEEPYKIVHGVVFQTKKDYEDAIHEFLNGN